MTKPTTIKELCEFIWYLEEKYHLIDLEIEGVKIWQCIRMQLYYKLAEISGVLSQPHSKLSKLGIIKHLLGYIKNSLINNYFTLKQKDIIIFSHPRVVNVDGELIDIYTKYLIDELIEKGENVVEFERVHLGTHQKEKKNFAHYTDWIELSQKIYKMFLKVNIPSDKLKVLKRVENEINTVCKSKIDLLYIISKSLKTYKANYIIFDKIFKKIKPKTFYTVVAYLQMPMIKALKDNDIEVIELQHGTFSKYHLGYSFPNRKEPLEYFPDKLYVWNGFWKNMIKLPIEDRKVVISKFRYLEVQKMKFVGINKKENQLVVLSQGAIGNDIAKMFLKHFDRFKDYDIKYKLHPGEFDRWQGYLALKRLNQFDNVEIIKNEIPLYELFASSCLQIGVFSTALYEGVEFGCNTILLDVNGIEYMDKFIELYKIEVLN